MACRRRGGGVLRKGDIMRVEVTGASDDLIELSGDIRDEFGAYDSDGDYLAFSDGTVLRIVYGEHGIWRVSRVCAGSADYEHTPGDVRADTFDVAVLTGDIGWAVCGKELVLSKAKG